VITRAITVPAAGAGAPAFLNLLGASSTSTRNAASSSAPMSAAPAIAYPRPVHSRIQQRPILGGLIDAYQAAAKTADQGTVAGFWNPTGRYDALMEYRMSNVVAGGTEPEPDIIKKVNAELTRWADNGWELIRAETLAESENDRLYTMWWQKG